MRAWRVPRPATWRRRRRCSAAVHPPGPCCGGCRWCWRGWCWTWCRWWGWRSPAHLIAGSNLGGQSVSRLVILAVIDAYAACAALLCVARMLLSPRTARLRLFHIPDATALYLMRWFRRLVLLAVFGYALGEVGLLLGLSEVAHDALQKAIGLVLHVCLAIIVIQKRRRGARPGCAPPPGRPA